ncbi:hypothetical protein FKM82_028411 [Ascaphus truei]
MPFASGVLNGFPSYTDVPSAHVKGNAACASAFWRLLYLTRSDSLGSVQVRVYCACLADALTAASSGLLPSPHPPSHSAVYVPGFCLTSSLLGSSAQARAL